MSERKAVSSAAIWARGLRITTGLIILVFVTTHLLNAGFGMISVNAMDAANPYLTGVWDGFVPGTLLKASLTAHFFLGLWAIYQRPTLRTNAQDIVQIVTAVLVLPIMATHVVGIDLAGRSGIDVEYADIMRLFWVDSPSTGLLQVVVIVVVWIHGSAGLLTWLRAKESARHVLPWVYPLVVAIPIFALLGYSEAGRSVLAQNAPAPVEPAQSSYGSTYSYGGQSDAPTAPESSYSYGSAAGYGNSSAASNTDAEDYGTPDQAATDSAPNVDFEMIEAVTNQVIVWSLILAALTFVARAVRQVLRPAQDMTVLRDGITMQTIRSGPTMLDAFRRSNQPHASLCEGRGRCGTCAVRIIASDFPLPEPTELELRTIYAKGLPQDARLACQLSPDGGRVEVEALYRADYSFHDQDDDPEDPTPDGAEAAPVTT